MRHGPVERLSDVLNDQFALMRRSICHHCRVFKKGNGRRVKGIICECQKVQIVQARNRFRELNVWQFACVRTGPEQVLPLILFRREIFYDER